MSDAETNNTGLGLIMDIREMIGTMDMEEEKAIPDGGAIWMMRWSDTQEIAMEVGAKIRMTTVSPVVCLSMNPVDPLRIMSEESAPIGCNEMQMKDAEEMNLRE